MRQHGDDARRCSPLRGVSQTPDQAERSAAAGVPRPTQLRTDADGEGATEHGAVGPGAVSDAPEDAGPPRDRDWQSTGGRAMATSRTLFRGPRETEGRRQQESSAAAAAEEQNAQDVDGAREACPQGQGSCGRDHDVRRPAADAAEATRLGQWRSVAQEETGSHGDQQASTRGGRRRSASPHAPIPAPCRRRRDDESRRGGHGGDEEVPGSTAAPQVALLSLFDGAGMARLAVEEALAERRGPPLVAAAYAEWDRTLGMAVRAAWARRTSATPGLVPYRYIAADVWDLFRCGHGGPDAPDSNERGETPLEAFADSLPGGATLLVVAGSPCQQLTYGGRYRGAQGLCGPDSVNFFAVPSVAWAMSCWRPDVSVHVVLENAASMRQEHRASILRALGGLDEGTNLRTIDSGQWAAFPRRRRFFLTIPTGEQVPDVPRRSPPWEEGWAPLRGARMGPMMCSRARDHPRASTVQYHYSALVYRWDPPCEVDWHGMMPEQARACILAMMPQNIRQLYCRLLGRDLSPREERAVTPAVDWIDREGRARGFRVPTARERACSTGRGPYLDELRLTEVQLYDAVGNHFDPDALRARLRQPLATVLNGSAARAHAFPTPSDLRDEYRQLARAVRGTGVPVQEAPWPQDIDVEGLVRASLTCARRECTQPPREASTWDEQAVGPLGSRWRSDAERAAAVETVVREGPGGSEWRPDARPPDVEGRRPDGALAPDATPSDGAAEGVDSDRRNPADRGTAQDVRPEAHHAAAGNGREDS